MYIQDLILENVRTYVKTKISFIHPDQSFTEKGSNSDLPAPQPRLPNVNLLLGDNGSGKSTILRTIAQAAFGPAVTSAGLRDPGLIRRASTPDTSHLARVTATFPLHTQDRSESISLLCSSLSVSREGELDLYEFDPPKDLSSLAPNAAWRPAHDPVWKTIYKSDNDAFFIVGYGATRRVERAENFDLGARTKSRFARAQRVASLFEDSFSLIPLTYWLPKLQQTNRGRYQQVVHLMNRLLGPGHYTFTQQIEGGDYLYERGGLSIPFHQMSDGYRAFIGWVADLLYHVNHGAPSGHRLDEGSGIVLVDEIDLHLHPKWQMKVIPTIAKALPRMQFIFTSHSPLVVGSLEWMNILTLKTSNKTNRTIIKRLKQGVHGLDADQILLSDFFGLTSTLAPAKQRQLSLLTDQIREGVPEAPLRLIREMTSGTEDEA